MRTINTIKNSIPPLGKMAGKNLKLRLKMQSACFYIFILIFGFSMNGYAQQDALSQAREYAQESQKYYEQAVSRYKKLIEEGRERDELYLELGKLYYSHADFRPAIETLKKSSQEEAKKFLSLAYYQAGQFTDALEIFERTEIADEEYLYYYGLTCEKLNLFDKAIQIYKKIKAPLFRSKVLARIEHIEKEPTSRRIKTLSPWVDKLLASAPSAKVHPQAGALILWCDEQIEVSPQNTQISYLHYIIKILNERGKEAFAEASIDYDSTFEKVELEYARTIKPDGTVAEVGARHLRDVSKYLNFPLYSNVRAFIISFPEIAEGATVEYKLKVFRSQLINKKDIVVAYPLQASEPIIAARFRVVMPKDKPLHIKILNAQYNTFGAHLEPKKTEQPEALLYSWEFKDIPQMIPEQSMPPNVEVNPTMLLSTTGAWEEIYRWWWSLAADKFQADPAIKRLVKELIRNGTCEEEKVRAIYNYCAQKIRYVAVEYGEAGYEPHYASDIFKNKYGDCKDQAVLLVTMLRLAGLNAWPVLIATKEYFNLNEDFPAMLFNHAIACVLVKERLVFLDPTVEVCSFDDLPGQDQSRKVLIIKEKSYQIQTTPLYPPRHNLIKQNLAIQVNEDESIVAKKEIFTFGAYDQMQRFWLLYTPPELIEAALKEKIQEVSIGARLISHKIENTPDLNKPVELAYTLQGPEYFIVAGALRLLPQLSGLDTSAVAREQRKYAIDFGILDSKESTFEVAIPRGFSIKYLPQSINEESPWLDVSCSFSARDSKVFVRQKVTLKKIEVAVDDYPAFKKFFEKVALSLKQRVVLEKK